MVLLIDNYDSFSYNLYQLIGTLYEDIKVIRNDALSVAKIRELNPSCIVISPGPGRPEDAGICIEVIQELSPYIPILGVCLGHQAICMAYGATVSYAKELMHGKQSLATLDTTSPLFKGCQPETPVARYHSLATVEATLPDCLQVIARSEDQEIMAVKHTDYDLYGMQFHPESIMTPEGLQMLRNFLVGCSNSFIF